MRNATGACPCGAYHPAGAVCGRAVPLANPEPPGVMSAFSSQGGVAAPSGGRRRDEQTAGEDEDCEPAHGPAPREEQASAAGCACSRGHAPEGERSREHDPEPEHGHNHDACAGRGQAPEAGCGCSSGGCAAPAREHDDSHGHGGCRGHDYAQAAPVDTLAVGEASDTRAVYRIVNMDCPMEEALIRKKLGNMPGISGLEFNLMRRLLTVHHELPSTEPVEAALKAIGMTPEPLGRSRGALAVFSVNGMDCPVEENLIRARLNGVPGVLGLEFNLMRRVLNVRHEPSALPAISEALESLNMDARLMDAAVGERNAVPEPRIPWGRLALAGAFAALSETVELISEWGAAPFGLDIGAWQVNGTQIAEWLPLALALPAILLSGLTTYKKGWLAVSNFNLNINALMSVAVTGAVIIGQYPEAAMVMVLFNLSEAIEAKALDRARNAIKDLLALTPETATVLRPAASGQDASGQDAPGQDAPGQDAPGQDASGQDVSGQGASGPSLSEPAASKQDAWVEMDIRQVAVGSRVRVKPGEKVALDGVIVSGRSAVNQAPITGESMPVEKSEGDTVYAGTINESGSFEFEVTAASTDSTLARIIHAVEEAQGSRAPIQRFVDQFSKYYTPAVFLTAILTAVIPPLLLGGAWAESVYTGLVILVIGCPCALVISTPVSIVSGMAAATRHGILIKGGMFLEQGRLLSWVALDKTGTITHGRPRQTDFVELGGIGAARAVAIAASIAARSDHPVSRAIAEDAEEKGVAFLDVDDFTAIPGQGVSGVIGRTAGAAGQKWHLGNHRMVEELKRCSPELEERIFALEQQGKTVVALVGDKGVQGLFAVADTLKDSSIEAVRELRKLGVKTMMLTGDNEHTARAIAAQVGVDSYKGNLLPEDKLRIIEELEAEGGKVGMVGDGINDAPALARADIGFAMAGNGTDTAIETADVALMDDDLRKIPRFIGLSRSTYAILAQNITLALAVKALFFALTFMGRATMWMAVFADVGAALIVVANGLRAMRK